MYYGGVVDLVIVLVSDAGAAAVAGGDPAVVVLSQPRTAGLYNGAVSLAPMFALTGWPSLWRALRGPALQVSERNCADQLRRERPPT